MFAGFFWYVNKNWLNEILTQPKVSTRTSITSVPVDQDISKTKMDCHKPECHKFSWLNIAKTRLIISGMVIERNAWDGLGCWKISLTRNPLWMVKVFIWIYLERLNCRKSFAMFLRWYSILKEIMGNNKILSYIIALWRTWYS